MENPLARIISDVRQEVSAELHNAMGQHRCMHSAHEGYAVILEEMDELWEEVKKNPKKYPEAGGNMRKEAIQLAAMAMRFVIDVCNKGKHES